jgi:hypothetical protein
MHRASGTRLPLPVSAPSHRNNPGEKDMAKKRSRRAASPAQIAARARFAAMVKSGAFGKKKKKMRRNDAEAAAAAESMIASAKKAAPKKAAKKKAAKKKAAKKAAPKKAAKKAAPKKAAKKAAPKKAAPKKAAPKETAKETKAFMAEARAGERAAKKAAMTPAERAKRAAAKRKRKARAAMKKKNAKKLGEIKAVLQSTRAELKATKGKRLKKGEKAGKRRARRAILKARKSALNLKRASLIGSIPAADRKLLEASGLLNVRPNPGFGDIFKDFATLAPQVGAHAVALAGVAVAGQKIGERMCKMIVGEKTGEELTKAKDGFIYKNAVTIGSVATAIIAYEAMKHASPKTRPFAGAVLLGGLAAAFVHAAARIKIESEKDGVKKVENFGESIGLPLTTPSLAGFIEVDGQQLAINGMGEYMALSGNTLTGSSLGEIGEYMALSGNTLTGSSLGEIGEYMALSGNTLTGSSLGEIGQMSEGRQGARALNSPGDPTVEDFMHEHEEDEGSLSGSIFDD